MLRVFAEISLTVLGPTFSTAQRGYLKKSNMSYMSLFTQIISAFRQEKVWFVCKRTKWTVAM